MKITKKQLKEQAEKEGIASVLATLQKARESFLAGKAKADAWEKLHGNKSMEEQVEILMGGNTAKGREKKKLTEIIQLDAMLAIDDPETKGIDISQLDAMFAIADDRPARTR